MRKFSKSSKSGTSGTNSSSSSMISNSFKSSNYKTTKTSKSTKTTKTNNSTKTNKTSKTNNTKKVTAGKRKARQISVSSSSSSTSSSSASAASSSSSLMWMDKHQPRTFQQLIQGVHKRKAEEVMKWIQAAAMITNSATRTTNNTSKTAPRLLIFHGPSGTGKSASIQAIAEESQVLLREWSGRHTDGDLPWKDAQRLRDHAFRSGLSSTYATTYQTTKASNEMEDFRTFLFTCQRYRGLTLSSNSSTNTSNNTNTSNASNNSSLMMIEHLPRLTSGSNDRIDPTKQSEFHTTLQDFLNADRAMPAAIVYSGNTEQAPSPEDLKRIFSFEVLQHPRTTVLPSRPISTTSLRRVLSDIVAKERVQVGSTYIENIIDTCLGDLRHAIMSLQFLCSGNNNEEEDMEEDEMESNEQHFVLFVYFVSCGDNFMQWFFRSCT